MPYKLEKFVRSNGTRVTYSYWEPFPNAPQICRQSEIYIEEPDPIRLDLQLTNSLETKPNNYLDFNKKLFPDLKDY